MSATLPIIIRNYKDGDKNFILNHYLHETSRLFPYKFMEYKMFNIKHSSNLTELLTKVSVALAVNPEEEDHIFSFVVYEKVEDITVIHFIYTKEVYRNQGIASELINNIFPEFGTKECIISLLPNLDDSTYNKYRELNLKELKNNNFDSKYQNPLRFYLMHNKLFYDAFLFAKRTIK